MSETTTEQLAEIEGQATEYTPPEGWRVLAVGEKLQFGDMIVRSDGYCFPTERVGYYVGLNNRYIRRIGPEPEPQPQPQPQPEAATIEELRSEVSYVQRLLGESRQRVKQLEELVASLRTINDAQEKTVRLAGQENTDLQHRLNVVSAEWAEQSETVRKLRIELDAAQQVPADSPELRQLRADLEQATLGRDTYQDGYNRVLSDLETIRETTKAETVETIAEWTEPFRTCGSERLALAVMANLPHIMRTLTGLTPED